MQVKKLIGALVAAGVLGAAGVASATPITFTFDPLGTGGANGVGNLATIDQSPGNSLAIGGVSGGSPALPVGTVIRNLYQANLATMNDTDGEVAVSNTGPIRFTFVAGFDERVISSSFDGVTATNSFQILSGGFFKMCAQAANGNNLAGTGFACDDASTILSGTILGGTGTQTGFVTNPVLFDQFGPDNHGGTLSVRSDGAANVRMRIDFADSNFFTDLLVGSALTVAFANTSNITPFQQTNPSFLFSSDGIANGDVANNIGAINGISGPNFQFQADANSSFARIPEPMSLALVGLALAGAGVATRRRQKAAAA